MDLNEIFRSMFGFPHHKPPDFPNERENPGSNMDPHSDTDIPVFFGFRGSGFGGMDQIFAHFHGDMQRQMEEMDKQMQDMFKNFGAVEFSDITEPKHYPSQRKPRDEMLKQPDSDHKPPNVVVPAPNPTPKFQRPWSFFGKWRHPSSETMTDTNLDDEIKNPEDLNKFFESKPLGPEEPGTRLILPDQRETTPRNFSFHRSMSVITRSSDGKVEQHKTVRDSSGQEEKTVTRSIGDQSYSVTTKTDQSGMMEKIENYHNMDENELHNFEKKWHGQDIRSSAPGHEMVKSDSPGEMSLLHRIFGFDPFRKGS